MNNDNGTGGDVTVVNVEAEELKEKGNSHYRKGEYALALGFFDKAIELDDTSYKYLVNRSLCQASLKNWAKSGEDAKRAIKLNPKYVKAHFRLIKALLELGRVKDARYCINVALKHCGDVKDFKVLEAELFEMTGIPQRPNSKDFDVVAELGEGNFTKIYKATYKKNGSVYAMKTIEKPTIDRMKRRHPNINNEILMEKRILAKLNHPNIVTLYSTFQDYGTLYYQMEFIGGADVWEYLQDHSAVANVNVPTKPHVGCFWSLARFFFAEALEAVEHMHRHGVVHRDIKPENMRITESGHLKFIDFGTAKDMIDTDLNGPEFVGTPEYMSPDTINNRPVGIEADLWAMGVVLFQLICGYTPYYAASPYLIFLRVKRAHLRIPDYVPEQIKDILRLLLDPDGRSRFASCCNTFNLPLQPKRAKPDRPQHKHGRKKDKEEERQHEGDAAAASTAAEEETGAMSIVSPSSSSSSSDSSTELLAGLLPESAVTKYSAVSYDKLKAHAFFSDPVSVNGYNIRAGVSIAASAAATTTTLATATTTDISVSSTRGAQRKAGDELCQLHNWKSVTERPAVRVPTLYELTLRAVGSTALSLAETISLNGGVKPQVKWMQEFDLYRRLTQFERDRIAHYLDRRCKQHLPGVHRLFYSSVIDSRSGRANANTREYLGFTRQLQGHWDKDFTICYLPSPKYSTTTTSNCAVAGNSSMISAEALSDQSKVLKQGILAINRLRPKFVVVTAHACSDSGLSEEEAAATAAAAAAEEEEEDAATATATVHSASTAAAILELKKNIARVSDSIPVVCVPGCIIESRNYSAAGGTSNNSRSRSSSSVTEAQLRASLRVYTKEFGADYYGIWFAGLRVLVMNSFLFVYKSLVPDLAAEQEVWLTEEVEQAKLCATSIVLLTYHPWYYDNIEEEDDEGHKKGFAIPAIPKEVRKFWLKKLRHRKVHLAIASSRTTTSTSTRSTTTSGSDSSSSNVYPCRPFPRVIKHRVANAAASPAAMSAAAAAAAAYESGSADESVRGSELKPSEIIQQAVQKGELRADEVNTVNAGEDTTTAVEIDILPPSAPAVDKEDSVTLPPAPPVAFAASNNDSDSGGGDSDDGGECNSEAGSGGEALDDDDGRGSETGSEYVNEDEHCEGPEILLLAPLDNGTSSTTTHSTAAASRDAAGQGNVQFFLIQDDKVQYRMYPPASIPKSIAELNADFD